ncbi:MAG: 3-oxoacyl-[acyl-carrier protein] reductase [Chloroflexi bacterium]|jgi:NAD(P)-dependent dehydrogenase (short-subunit alcohol dehydrogenase family)|nr:MAG: 3-oxoacyl-[acyl-carrier protein] reductase [Chloroflexota bacterium]
MKFQGKTALVTGASRNIGRALALAFAAEGANVVVHGYKDKAAAEETARMVEGKGVKALTVIGDVGDREEVGRFVGEAISVFGAVDILVSNVGYRPKEDTLTISAESWRRVLASNLDGPFFVAQAVLPGMIERHWGRIVNISGGGAFNGVVGEPHVAAAKAGLLGLTRTLAKEFAKDNILSNTVVPGTIQTEDSNYRTPGRDYPQIAVGQPLGRVTQPEEVADLCLYLCDPAQQSINGQAFHINGGTLFS